MIQNQEKMAERARPSTKSGPSRSGRLHEFQAMLLDRMNAARDNADMRGSRLGVIIGDRCSLIDLREAEEIIHLLPIVRVPLTKDWYLGLANVRGNLIGVVDLDRFLGGDMQVTGKQSRIIVASDTLSAACGFLVSRVMGLRNLHAMSALKHDNGALTSGSYLDCDRKQWTEISLTRIVKDSRFLRVGLSAASSAAGE